MKSLQQDHKIIRTSCKDCVFAEYKDNTQISCLHGRIETFPKEIVIEAYDDEKEFFVINRFCNLYRDKNVWNNGNADTEKAFNEIKLTFDVLIDCENINDDEYFNYIKSVVASSVLYGSSKINFYFYHSQSLDKDGRKKVLNLNRMTQNSSLSVYFQKNVLQHNIFSKTSNSYHIIVTPENKPDKRIFDLLNNLVNKDLQKILVCQNNNAYIISNLSYKIETSGKIDIDFNQSIQNIINYAQPDYYIEI